MAGLGAAAGAGLMYMLDPSRGARRRSLVRDKMVHSAKQTGASTRRLTDYLKGRLQGVLHETRARFRSEAVADDRLCARVRSALGRVVSYPGEIVVRSEGGIVTLSGRVLADEANDLLRTVWKVRGVRGVHNELDVRDQIAGQSSMPPRKRPRQGLMREYWTPDVRLIAGLTGTGLAIEGFRRGGIVGITAGVIGAGLLTRALTNLSARRLVGIGAGHRVIDVHKTITIAAPLDQVFGFFSNYRNFPHFMSNVREVRDEATGRSHWVVAGPAGTNVEWDALITDYNPNQVIAWRSVEGSPVEHAGFLRFEPTEGGTRVDVQLSYNPPGGALGHAVAKIFGADPKSELDQDLMRAKTAIETGQPAHDVAQPVG